MSHLKTISLMSSLLIFSFASNASYSGSGNLIMLMISSSPIGVVFNKDTMTFDDVIPGDTLTGDISVSINADSDATLTCTLDGQQISSTHIVDLDLDVDIGGFSLRFAELDFTMDACSKTGSELLISGQIPDVEIPADTTLSRSIDFAISYGGTTTVFGVGF